jgi:hypothetical protein
MSTRCFFDGGTTATFSAPENCNSSSMQRRQIGRTLAGDDSARQTARLQSPEQVSTRDCTVGSSISDTSAHSSAVDCGGILRRRSRLNNGRINFFFLLMAYL